MAGIVDTFRQSIIKALGGTDPAYNKLLYQWLGTSIIMQEENDQSFIVNGYQRNATVYSIINLITKAATTIPFQIYEVNDKGTAKQYKAMTSGIMDGGGNV